MLIVCPNCQRTMLVPKEGKTSCRHCLAVLLVHPLNSGKPVQLLAVAGAQGASMSVRNANLHNPDAAVAMNRYLEAAAMAPPPEEEEQKPKERKIVYGFPFERPFTGFRDTLRLWYHTWRRVVMNSTVAFSGLLNRQTTLTRSLLFSYPALVLGLSGQFLTMGLLYTRLYGTSIIPRQLEHVYPGLVGQVLESPGYFLTVMWAVSLIAIPALMLLWSLLLSRALRMSGNTVPVWQDLRILTRYSSGSLLLLGIPLIGPLIALPLWLSSTHSALVFLEEKGGWKMEWVLLAAYLALAVIMGAYLGFWMNLAPIA